MPASNKTQTTTTKTATKPPQKKATAAKGIFVTSEQLEVFLDAQRQSFARAVTESQMQLKTVIEQTHHSLSREMVRLVTTVKTLEDKINSLTINPGFTNTHPTNNFPPFFHKPHSQHSFHTQGSTQLGTNYASLRDVLMRSNLVFPSFIPYTPDCHPTALIIDIGEALPGTMTGMELALKLDSVIVHDRIHKTILLGAQEPGLKITLTSIEQLIQWSRNRHDEMYNSQSCSVNNNKQTRIDPVGYFTPFSLMGIITELKNSKTPFVRVLNFDFKFERVYMGNGGDTAIVLRYDKRDEGVLSCNGLGEKLEAKLQEQVELLSLNIADVTEKPFFATPCNEGPLSMIQSAPGLVNWLDSVKKD